MLADALQMAVPLRGRGLGRFARHGRGPGRHDDRCLRMALGDAGVNARARSPRPRPGRAGNQSRSHHRPSSRSALLRRSARCRHPGRCAACARTGASWCHVSRRWCTRQIRGEMAANPKLLRDDRLATDGIRASGRQYPVQHRHADGSLSLLGREAAGSQTRSDQRLVTTHYRFY